MANNPQRVGLLTKRIAWTTGVMLVIAALTSSAVPWQWGFALFYVTTAFGLQTLVRLKDPGIERLAHVAVLSGSSPILVRSFYGSDLGVVGAVHVVAMLGISIGIGYLLGDRVRPRTQRPRTT